MPEANIVFSVTQKEVATLAAAIAAEMQKHFKVEPTLTLAEAAEEIGISVQSMRALCRDKKIPAIKLEKSYRIKVVDLNRFLDEHMQATEAAG